MSAFCTECGSRRQSPEERFCGSCGSPFGTPPPAPPASAAPATAAPAAAPTPSPAPSPPHAATAGQTPWGAAPTTGAAGPAPRGGPWLRRGVIGLVLALVLVGGGAVAWQVLGPRGGAGTPDAAVSGLVEALLDQDPVAVLDLIVPGEVEGIDDVAATARDRLDSLGLTNGNGMTDAVSASVSDLELEVHEVGDDLAVVSLVGGTARLSYDPAKLPEALSSLRGRAPAESWTGSLTERYYWAGPDLDEEDERYEPFVVTARVDGRWYVTLAGTYLDWWLGGVLVPDAYIEQDMAEQGIRAPDPEAVGSELDPITGEDVEDVLAQVQQAINTGDIESLVAGLPADTTVGMRPFIRTWEDILRREELSFGVSVDDLDVSSEKQGDHLRVEIDAAAVSGWVSDYDYDAGSARLVGTCGYATEYDSGYEDGGCLPGAFTDNVGVDRPFLLLRQVGDGYQLDPVATVVEYARTALDAFPDSTAEDLLAALRDDSTYSACLALGLGDLC